MTQPQARFVTTPIVEPIGQMRLMPQGIAKMVDWVHSRAPACIPDDIALDQALVPSAVFMDREIMKALFPHDLTEDGRDVTDNELLVELAGRKCYNSFGNKAGRKTNGTYIAHTQEGAVPHRSIAYHAKMSFFIAGVSRRVSHELIRNYVGADRTEEGAPSQESTRYVENAGFYVTPPRYLQEPHGLGRKMEFEGTCQRNFEDYRRQIHGDIVEHKLRHGAAPKGIDYKRILEAASGTLIHSVETSFVWTTNPMALAKLFMERDNEAADLEFQRFARQWKRVCVEHWPNLVPQPHMREGL